MGGDFRDRRGRLPCPHPPNLGLQKLHRPRSTLCSEAALCPPLKHLFQVRRDSLKSGRACSVQHLPRETRQEQPQALRARRGGGGDVTWTPLWVPHSFRQTLAICKAQVPCVASGFRGEGVAAQCLVTLRRWKGPPGRPSPMSFLMNPRLREANGFLSSREEVAELC